MTKLFIYVLLTTTIIGQLTPADAQETGGGTMAVSSGPSATTGSSGDTNSMVLRSHTSKIMDNVRVSGNKNAPIGTGTDEEIAQWFNKQVLGTPLEGKGEDAVRYCQWDYDHKDNVQKEWSDRGRWTNNCVRSTVAVGRQEQSLCTRDPGISVKNCFSLHVPGRKSSYVRWDGKSIHKGSETIRKYTKYDDCLRDFIWLQSSYYYGKMMKSPHGMSYAESPTWRNRIAMFYNAQ